MAKNIHQAEVKEQFGNLDAQNGFVADLWTT